MTDEWFFRVNHRLDNKRKSNFMSETSIHHAKIFNWALVVIFLLLFVIDWRITKTGRIEGRPLELLATKDIEIEIWDYLSTIFAAIHDNSIPFLQISLLSNLCSHNHHVSQNLLVLL